MPIKYEFKRAGSDSFAPGFSTLGNKGDDGAAGINGRALYFTTFEIDNSFYKNMALEKIKNNFVLSNFSSNVLPEGRSYQDGDYILSNKGSVYQLYSPDGGKTLDIVKLDTISDDIPNPITSVDVMVGALVGGDGASIDNNTYESPTGRSNASPCDFDSNTATTYDKAFRRIFAAKVNIRVNCAEFDVVKYDISLGIRFKGRKSV